MEAQSSFLARFGCLLEDGFDGPNCSCILRDCRYGAVNPLECASLPAPENVQARPGAGEELEALGKVLPHRFGIKVQALVGDCLRHKKSPGPGEVNTHGRGGGLLLPESDGLDNG